MSATRTSLVRLARGLERYDGEYEALKIFADDVEELHAIKRRERLPADLEARAIGNDLVFKVKGQPYRMTISAESGIARLTRGAGASGESDFTVLGGIVGSAIGLASGSKGEGWVPGLILGLLAGQLMDGQRRVRAVAVRYDPRTEEWRAYGGPMSQWMRQQAAPS